jgi:hypothetical protein
MSMAQVTVIGPGQWTKDAPGGWSWSDPLPDMGLGGWAHGDDGYTEHDVTVTTWTTLDAGKTADGVCLNVLVDLLSCSCGAIAVAVSDALPMSPQGDCDAAVTRTVKALGMVERGRRAIGRSDFCVAQIELSAALAELPKIALHLRETSSR